MKALKDVSEKAGVTVTLNVRVVDAFVNNFKRAMNLLGATRSDSVR